MCVSYCGHFGQLFPQPIFDTVDLGKEAIYVDNNTTQTTNMKESQYLRSTVSLKYIVFIPFLILALFFVYQRHHDLRRYIL